MSGAWPSPAPGGFGQRYAIAASTEGFAATIARCDSVLAVAITSAQVIDGGSTARAALSHCVSSPKLNNHADSRFDRALEARYRRGVGGNAVTVATGDKPSLLVVDRPPTSRSVCSCMGST